MIAKLRTSGSEISKIQEVGRGLRLPVDETGHRLQQDEYQSRLTFLIGYDEKEFAQTLVNQVNEDAPIELNHEPLSIEMIKLIIEERQKTELKFNEDKLLDDLDKHNIITRSNKFKDSVDVNGNKLSGYEALVQLYPEVEHRIEVSQDKIRDKNNTISTRIKLRKSNWELLKNLWLGLSKRQMIKFDDDVIDFAEIVAREVFKDQDSKIFVLQRRQINK